MINAVELIGNNTGMYIKLIIGLDYDDVQKLN